MNKTSKLQKAHQNNEPIFCLKTMSWLRIDEVGLPNQKTGYRLRNSEGNFGFQIAAEEKEVCTREEYEQIEKYVQIFKSRNLQGP